MNNINFKYVFYTLLGVGGLLLIKKQTSKLLEVEDIVENEVPMQDIKYNSALKIRFDRYIFTEKETIGKMYLNGEYFCDTLEDKYRGQYLANDIKVQNETAIPNGTYECVVNWSPTFKKFMVGLLNVPYFKGIRIHTGSSVAHTSGCILVGDYKNGKWYANSKYSQELVTIIPEYKICSIQIRSI